MSLKKRRDPYTGTVQWQRLTSAAAASHRISRKPPEGLGKPLSYGLRESMALAAGTVPFEAALCVVSAGSPRKARRVGGRRKGKSRPRAESWTLKVQRAAWGTAERWGLSTPGGRVLQPLSPTAHVLAHSRHLRPFDSKVRGFGHHHSGAFCTHSLFQLSHPGF